MLVFDQNRQLVNLPYAVDIDDGEINLAWCSDRACVLEGRVNGEWIPLLNRVDFKSKVKFQGFTALRLTGAKGQTAGVNFGSAARRIADPVDQEKFVSPPLPQNNNLLLQIQRMMREEMKRATGPTMDPEDGGFENRHLIDEDDDRFEEELAAEAAAAKSAPDPQQDSGTQEASEEAAESEPASPSAGGTEKG